MWTIRALGLGKFNITKRSLHQKVVKGYTSVLRKDDIDTAEYYFENGLRKVKPYNFSFLFYAKVRMYGATVLNTFLREYRGRTEGYYRYAIDKGMITVNGRPTTPDTILQHNDLIAHTVHRHEPPVTDKPIEIVHEDKDLFVINKPASIQVHPSGRYRHNTVIHIMRKELESKVLFPSNRLDRITSGLMLISKNPQEADRIGQEMRSGQIRKEYVCRVSGEFPRERIVCSEPIQQLAYTVNLNYVHPQGKACTTIFERLSFNGETSVVRCRPLSGRTHQIRVHLRYLGHPIANDPIYGYSTAWSERIIRGQTIHDVPAMIKTMVATAPYDYMDDDPTNTTVARCQDCNVPVPQSDPIPAQLSLWLHAYKYAGPHWTYQTPQLPAWAHDDYKHDINIIPASF
ncbi:uncharacterized protein EV154DRAFT_491277 [Mucor mucedo]|uniref:uncharacterized protein n=1 Tax=Mucor mucedo TaxID=29922 RepID=UPI00222002E4|nr:uncharacterized protein EV154DRAFT_491277 [Mucor mucedo]KAI7896933.1 hypothetical protein EV154DRAFT_491277 [Mucor mucedo]